MGKTIAEVLYEEGFAEGMLKGRREGLLHLLRLQLEHMLAEIEATINAPEDLKQLDDWFDKVAVAKNLSEIHIPLKRTPRGKKRGKARR